MGHTISRSAVAEKCREKDQASRAEGNARGGYKNTAERLEIRRTFEDACKAFEDIQTACRREFAAARGWTWRKAGSRMMDDIRRAGFPAWSQGPCLDHTDVFYADRRVVALVTHAYVKEEELAQYARKNGLLLELLPWSWYWPEVATAGVFTVPKAEFGTFNRHPGDLLRNRKG